MNYAGSYQNRSCSEQSDGACYLPAPFWLRRGAQQTLDSEQPESCPSQINRKNQTLPNF